MELKDRLVEALKRAVTTLPDPVVEKLEEARSDAEEPAETQLSTILENIHLAAESGRPMCQDTGMQTFYVRAGSEFPRLEEVRTALHAAVEEATGSVPLRPNTVDPVTGKNPGDNSGRHMPAVHWEVVPGNSCNIGLLPKGGGAENISALKMLNPEQGVGGAVDFIVDRVVEAGGLPCPPVVLGVGLGGGADLALSHAKKALLRPVDRSHPESEVAQIEKKIKNKVNERGRGPMGLGGRPTVLGVNAAVLARHPASFPVGLVVQCWAHRRSFVEVNADGCCEVKKHWPPL